MALLVSSLSLSLTTSACALDHQPIQFKPYVDARE
jgi:hypothetical protein